MPDFPARPSPPAAVRRLLAAGLAVLGLAAAGHAATKASLRAQLAGVPRGAGAIAIALSPTGGHVLGSAAAKVKLVEYMSYTCPHCAHFESEGMPQLRLAYVSSGKVSIEIRHLLRDPVDATVAQLTNCASPARFFAFHEDMLLNQPRWLILAQQASEAQQARWGTGDTAARMRAIAGDLHLYDYAERHGIDRTAADRCFANTALADRLAAQTVAAAHAGITSTPSFMIGDLPLAGTFSWATLRPQIDVRL